MRRRANDALGLRRLNSGRLYQAGEKDGVGGMPKRSRFATLRGKNFRLNPTPMKNFKKIKEKFNQLPRREKDSFIQDIYKNTGNSIYCFSFLL